MTKVIFNIEDNPLAEFDAEKLTVKFKNGREYSLTVRDYISGMVSVMDRFDLLNMSNIEKQLIEKRNADLAQEAKWRGITPRTVKHIKIAQFEKNLSMDKVSEYMVQPERGPSHNLKFTAESVMNFDGEPDEVFPRRIYDSINTVFTQFGKYMDASVQSCQYVNTKDRLFPRMYFYTYGATEGNAEIWYKAIDPIVWFGTPTGKAGK